MRLMDFFNILHSDSVNTFIYFLTQIEAAYSHLVKYNDSMDRDVRFAVTCGNAGGLKGIHLRGHEATKSVEIPVKVSYTGLFP